jgi:hypothetical protein
MKNLLELTQEFAALDDAKTTQGGRLNPPFERRWKELKRFYEVLMSQTGVLKRSRRRFSAAEVRRMIVPRSRLRVRTEIEVAIKWQKHQFDCAKMLNLSRGGALLATKTEFQPNCRLELTLGPIDTNLLTRADVVWCARSTDRCFSYKTGIRFLKLHSFERKKLDSFIVETLERQLLSFDPVVLDPGFVERECLVF